MTEGALAMLAMQQGAADARGTPLRRGGELLNGGAACYRVYRTGDGRFVALGALEPRFFARFCEAAGRPELAERQLDGDGRGPVEELEALFLTRTRDQWASLGREEDLCLAPVLEGDEPRRDPQLRARGAFVEVPTPWEGRAMPGIATPVRLAGVESPRRAAPRLGEDTEAVLREGGFTPDEVATLYRDGVAAAACP
jgi:crotonobetainyl-CoA:carnitine CoA-transferase CaiB-like acyl-CoA transferase